MGKGFDRERKGKEITIVKIVVLNVVASRPHEQEPTAMLKITSETIVIKRYYSVIQSLCPPPSPTPCENPVKMKIVDILGS